MDIITFVCYGNICRSPMAEFVFNDLIAKQNLSDKFVANSRATSREEEGSGVYMPTIMELVRRGVPYSDRCSTVFTLDDYNKAKYIVCMDRRNYNTLMKMTDNDSDKKIRMLLSFDGDDSDVADPWYTRDFARSYDDILRGCKALIGFLTK